MQNTNETIGYNTNDAAQILNRSPQTLRQWNHYQKGDILPKRINGRLFWLKKDIDALVCSKQSTEKREPIVS